MAKRGRRRAGEDTYQSSSGTLPRSLILDLLDAVYSSSSSYKRPLSNTYRGYGGGHPPMQSPRSGSYRRMAQSFTTSLPSPRSMTISGSPRRQAPPSRTSLLKAHLLRSHIVGSSIPTMLSDRKTEAVKRPHRVTQCTQRQDRKQVLHALGVAGRSGGSPGKRGTYKRNLMSNFSCKG